MHEKRMRMSSANKGRKLVQITVVRCHNKLLLWAVLAYRVGTLRNRGDIWRTVRKHSERKPSGTLMRVFQHSVSATQRSAQHRNAPLRCCGTLRHFGCGTLRAIQSVLFYPTQWRRNGEGPRGPSVNLGYNLTHNVQRHTHNFVYCTSLHIKCSKTDAAM